MLHSNTEFGLFLFFSFVSVVMIAVFAEMGCRTQRCKLWFSLEAEGGQLTPPPEVTTSCTLFSIECILHIIIAGDEEYVCCGEDESPGCTLSLNCHYGLLLILQMNEGGYEVPYSMFL